MGSDVEFPGSGYSLDELAEFTYRHTGAGNPAMGVPTLACHLPR